MEERDLAILGGAESAGRVPPHSLAAERGFLGCVLLDATRVMDLGIEQRINPETFYYGAHQILFEVMIDLHERHQPIDLLTLGERLRVLNQLDSIGGPEYLRSLVDSTPTSIHAEHYIDMVYSNYLLRRIIDTSRDAADKCYDPELDAQTILNQTEEAFFSLVEAKPGQVGKWSELIAGEVEHINTLLDNKKRVHGIPTGFRDLDQMLTGMQKTDMIILAARPSMGKTSLALNIAEHVAMGVGNEEGRVPVAVFSLEMSREQLVRRMLCCHAEVPFHKLTGGYFSKENHQKLMEGAARLRDLPIYIDDTAGLDVLDLRARARRMHRKFGIGFVVIDYLQLMHCSRVKENKQQEVAAISGQVKALAKELRVPVLVLSQLNRAAETRDKSGKPKLSDLRDSGSIEQDADVVMLLRRPSRYKDDPEADDLRLSYVDIAKHRNGPCGEIRLNFDGDYTRFSDRADREEEWS